MNTTLTVEFLVLVLATLLFIAMRVYSHRRRRIRLIPVEMINADCNPQVQIKLCKVLRPHNDGTLHAYEQ